MFVCCKCHLYSSRCPYIYHIYQHNRYKYFRLFGLRLIRLRHPRGKPSFFSPLLLFPSLPLVLPVFFCLGVEYMCWKGVLRNVCAS